MCWICFVIEHALAFFMRGDAGFVRVGIQCRNGLRARGEKSIDDRILLAELTRGNKAVEFAAEIAVSGTDAPSKVTLVPQTAISTGAAEGGW